MFIDCRSAYHSTWDPHVDVVIGLNKQYLTTSEDVIEHVEDLIFVILSKFYKFKMSEDVLGHVVHLIFVVLSKFYKFTMSEDVLGHVMLY